MMNLSIYNANLDIINISSALFRIIQHIRPVQQQETLERLAALPPVPIKRITMELMGEVLQETLSSDKLFWLCPSFLMVCIRFIVSIMSTVACIVKKKVAAWKPPALTGFSLYVGRTRITQKWMMRIWTDPYTNPVASC